MSEFKVGQQVVVGNNPLEAGLRGQRADAHLYYYLGTLSDGAIAVRVVSPDGSDYVECFQYVTPMLEGENKMKEEFEMGQQVAVSDVSIKRALEQLEKESVKYYYLVTLTNGAIVVRAVSPNGSDFVSCFNYIAAIPDAPIVTMFTHKTFPRGLVYVREKDSPAIVESENLALGIRQGTVATSSGSQTYARLAESFEMSLDNCETWVPCGELK